MTSSDHVPVMPFVSVASVGGPHDDTSYAAGYECGAIDARLEGLAGCYSLAMEVLTANLSQLDLVAMRRGYDMIYHFTGDPRIPGLPKYTFATFLPVGNE